MRQTAWRWALTGALASAMLSGCTGHRGDSGRRAVRFEDTHIVADLELSKLNDEELFAAGSSAFAASDFKNATRFFGRLADFHPDSAHRRPALYNAGLAHAKMQEWEAAYFRFQELADPAHGKGDALDASFRMAETLYHLERYAEAAALLETIAERTDVSANERIEAQVQQGICQLEQGESQLAEQTLRAALERYTALVDPSEVEDYFPCQAQFFLGEIYRLHYESVVLDPKRGIDPLAQDLEYKAQLLLSAQGHYLRAIRMGNGYWATAAGAQIGGLYENLYAQMTEAPVPEELSAEEGEVYRQELRKKVRVLISKSISVYERTLEAAERIGANNPFVDRTRESLRKMKALLVADAAGDESASHPKESQEQPGRE